MIDYLLQPFRFIRFMIYYFIVLMKANLKIFVDILSPKLIVEPGIAKLPLITKNDFEITMLACLISITPGSRVIAITAEPPTLYVHGVFAKDPDIFREELWELEAHMVRALRRPKNVEVRSK